LRLRKAQGEKKNFTNGGEEPKKSELQQKEKGEWLVLNQNRRKRGLLSAS